MSRMVCLSVCGPVVEMTSNFNSATVWNRDRPNLNFWVCHFDPFLVLVHQFAEDLVSPSLVAIIPVIRNMLEDGG